MEDLVLEAMQYKVKVLQSHAGYYIGQLDSDGGPFTRLSGYYRPKSLAEMSLARGFYARMSIETKPIIEELIRQGHLEVIDTGCYEPVVCLPR